MKKLLRENKSMIVFVTAAFFVWRMFLFVPQFLGEIFLPKKEFYLGEIPWANFDGGHYLRIAENGYSTYQEAFFPLFPALINLIATVFGIDYLVSALFIVHVSLFVCLILIWKLVRIDFNERVAKYAIVFFLLFPTSFFFVSIYTESLFLALVLSTFYAARKEKWLLAGILGGFATGARFVGIFLLPALIIEFFIMYKKGFLSGIIEIKKFLGLLIIPMGLIIYMIHLNNIVGDPLAFVHAQPAFGANRTGGDIILLPQVIYRYINIFLNVPLDNYNFWIAVLEFFSFSAVFIVLIYSIKRVRFSYILFSLLSIIIPTFTGTFSSMPRYVIIAFPIFIVFAINRNIFLRSILIAVFLPLLIILTMLFTRGYWVS